MYLNYHKHTHYSNLMLVDSNAKIEDYCKRIIELGQDTYFTTEHGWGGDVFDCKTTCDKYKLKCVYGCEAYIVKDASQKDKSNYHIIVIPKTDKARKKFNKILTRANKEGYYYRPRLFLEDLLNCDKEDFYFTTACIAGLLRTEESYNDIFLPLFKHFGENILLEVQNHDDNTQKEINKKVLKLSQQYGLKIIHANDSHYIYEQDYIERNCLLEGKGIEYNEESEFILDFPDEETIYKRYEKQGILTKEQVKEALDNTLIFHNIENLILDKEIKMPNIYPNLTVDERVNLLKRIVAENFQRIIKEDKITNEELPKYKQMIREEMQVIEDTKEINTQDYFLLNYKLIDLAVNKYKGVLTTTSRGSAGGFYLNHCLNITQLDRGRAEIPLYYERFMSKDRLLENHSLPDVDFNIVNPEPFIEASKELLGENGCRWMIAYGTCGEAEAFRNVCRSKKISFDEYNEVGKNLEQYQEDERWKPIIEESKKYVGTIVSASQHPCSNLLYDKDIEEELGCLKIGEVMCAPITSGEADEWKFLKNDYLTVVTVDITKQVFDLVGKPRMSLVELQENLDEKTWDIYKNGLTCTVNQVDSDWATALAKTYKPHSVFELANFTGCLRPSFENNRNDFVNRVEYHNVSPQLDELFKATDNFVLYQENLMQFFEYFGISPAKSIGLIKKISKKKIHKEDFDALTETLKKNWLDKIGDLKDFDKTWDMMQSYMGYGYNSPHALSMAYDSLYNAYLKAHYPLEYYTIVLDMYKDDEDRTNRLTNELDYFNIKLYSPKFGKAKAEYTLDKSTNSIYKGVSSIKYLNSTCANELYNLAHSRTYTDFYSLLKDISEKTSTNSKQLMILIKLGYFDKFGKTEKLLKYYYLYDKFNNKKTIKKAEQEILVSQDYETWTIPIFELAPYCEKETEKQYSQFDSEKFIRDYWDKIEDKDIPLNDTLISQKEYLGYVTYKNPKLINIYMVTDFKTPYSKSNPVLELYCLQDGEIISCKVKDKYKFEEHPFGQNSIIEVKLLEQKYKNKKEVYTEGAKDWSKKEISMGYRWVKSSDVEWILSSWNVIKR